MKKKYEKPQVVCEVFKLSRHIVACDYILNSSDVTTCETKSSNTSMFQPGGFVSENTECRYIIDGYCYSNASSEDLYETFNS